MNINIWIASVVAALLLYVVATIGVIGAHFPNLGYPCLYAEVIDYSNINLTTYNVIHQLTPQLFLTPLQTKMYTALTLIVLGVFVIYQIICVVRIHLNKENAIKVNQSTKDIKCVGSASTSFYGSASMALFYVFINNLSFKAVALAAFIHTLYFICFTVLIVMLVTGYQSADQTLFNLSRIHPKISKTIKLKTIIINILQFLLGFATLVTVLTLGLTFGNSFYVKTYTVAFSAINFFFFVFLIYFIVMEAVLTRYMKAQFGYYLGIFFALIALLIPLLQYENMNGSKYFTGIITNILTLFFVWICFFLTRIIRFFKKSVKYTIIDTMDDAEEENEIYQK